MIADIKDVKRILQITDSTYDLEIETLLPIVQDDICEYLNNYFSDPIVYRDGDKALEFVRGTTGTTDVSADYITDTDANFKTSGFTTDRQYDILVDGGGFGNSGIHHVRSLSTAGGTMTLDSTGALNDVDMDDMDNATGRCRISLIVWPKSLKMYVAQMVWWMIKQAKSLDIKSERIDDYSVTYVNGHAYPERVIKGLQKYRIGNAW